MRKEPCHVKICVVQINFGYTGWHVIKFNLISYLGLLPCVEYWNDEELDFGVAGILGVKTGSCSSRGVWGKGGGALICTEFVCFGDFGVDGCTTISGAGTIVL